MRKLLTLLCLCLLVTSSAFSKPLSDNYPQQSVGLVVFGIEDAKYLFDLSGEKTETGVVTKEVVSALKDKFAIDLEKDVEQIGSFFVPTDENAAKQLTMPKDVMANPGYEPVMFLCGEFDSKTIISAVKKLIASAGNEAPKLDTISIGEKKYLTLSAKDNRLIFFKKNMLLFCKDTIISLMQKNKLTFSKAPASFEGLQERANSFFELKKPVTNFINNFNLPIPGLERIDSLSGYLTKDFLYAEAGFKDEETAKSMFNDVEKFKKDFYEEQTKNYEAAKANIYTAPFEQLFEDINKMYTSAKNKDIVDHLKISQKGSSIVVAQPYDKDDKLVIAVGGIGIIAAAAIPNFKAARGSAREKACFSNQRVLMGAVEMYNMDHDTMMTTLDIPVLVKEKYLKSAPVGPEPECEYFSIGDLSGDGVVACKRHGGIPMK